MTAPLICLGLESSCDDTAAAVLSRAGGTSKILSNVVMDQADLHAAFGGVVPEIAARTHAEKIDIAVEQALIQAGKTLQDVGLIAVTAGPGLIGGVVAGVMCAKGLATALDVPMIGVNHLAGHALTPRLTDGVAFPYLMLLVSGGHCQFLITHGPDHFERLGGTIDDAPGEAFDKTARILGLPQPGGPAVQNAATMGDAKRFPLPRPLLDRPDMDLSFSGLKTAVLRSRDSVMTPGGTLAQQDVYDLCASFQLAVTDVLVEKTRRAIVRYMQLNLTHPTFAVAGGVAANTALRAGLETVCETLGVTFTAPPLALCTDNAAMIAHTGLEMWECGHRSDMTLAARPRWPLDQTQASMLGSGKKGAKA